MSLPGPGPESTGPRRRPRSCAKAKPLLAVDLRDIVERLKPNKPIDVRDGAILTVGWAGALRRCELVELDWLPPVMAPASSPWTSAAS